MAVVFGLRLQRALNKAGGRATPPPPPPHVLRLLGTEFSGVPVGSTPECGPISLRFPAFVSAVLSTKGTKSPKINLIF